MEEGIQASNAPQLKQQYVNMHSSLWCLVKDAICSSFLGLFVAGGLPPAGALPEELSIGLLPFPRITSCWFGGNPCGLVPMQVPVMAAC